MRKEREDAESKLPPAVKHKGYIGVSRAAAPRYDWNPLYGSLPTRYLRVEPPDPFLGVLLPVVFAGVGVFVFMGGRRQPRARR